MIALASRILMIALAGYSYSQIRTYLPNNPSAAPAGIGSKLLFGIQLLVTLVFFIAPFFPESIHFGSRCLSDYAPGQLERIMPMVKDMLGLMGLLMTLYFSLNVRLSVVQARSAEPRKAARSIVAAQPWLIGTLLVGEAVITLYYLRRIDSMANSDSSHPTSSGDSTLLR
jgi:TRAP-type C4-dicarboxylate transport system permease small subunit